MQFIGSMTFFMMGSVIHFCLGLFAVFRIMQRPPVIPEERGGFVTLGVRATPIATVAAIEDAQDSVDNSLTEK
ncbi:MAG: hypothetical protein PSN37_05050 [Alphaproteobacteria bacterium]|nr:hypothetical protein [Alphaproteobacteria bacterium]